VDWAPDGRSIVVGDQAMVVRLRLDGRVWRRYLGRRARFLRDGSLVVQRRDGLYLFRGANGSRLVSRAALSQAAGMPLRSFSLADYGAAEGAMAPGLVAVQGSGARGAVLLVVNMAGRIWRAAPFFGRDADGQRRTVGGQAWGPDAHRPTLYLFATAPDPSGRWDHLHCLALWSPRRGYRQVGSCDFRHFNKLLWASNGRTALLNSGEVIDMAGHRRSGPRRLAAVFAITWSPVLR
jgi:hypothetical protein